MSLQVPHYPLRDVRAAARTGSLVLRRRAERDSTNLGYFERDVAECLLSLTEENFLKTETYTHNARQTECDVYLINYTGPSGDADELYVKFSFNGWVTVYSFHLRRR